ncbi:hypothetical protein J1TS3_38220 [Siminovitchia fordii]|uniref:Uncharacterized protein n=1 Tax=Siminovitchia fordii TaxID=254759 RepID=A0ABQ4KAD0_9BACI|nr:hypothetical protein J1TS3_38220 [Siminovitchia fordii]
MVCPDKHNSIPEEAYFSHHREMAYDLEPMALGRLKQRHPAASPALAHPCASQPDNTVTNARLNSPPFVASAGSVHDVLSLRLR